MRKAVVTLLWLLVAFTVPVGSGFNAICGLAHAGGPLRGAHATQAHSHDGEHGAVLAEADEVGGDARSAHGHSVPLSPVAPSHTHAPNQQHPTHADHGKPDFSCCHTMNLVSNGLPAQAVLIGQPAFTAAAPYWLAHHPIRGHAPPPALGPPRA